MKGLYVNTTDMRRSFQQVETSDGGIILGLESVKYISYIGTTRFCRYDSALDGVWYSVNTTQGFLTRENRSDERGKRAQRRQGPYNVR